MDSRFLVGGLVSLGAVFLVLAVWATLDRHKYDPIYSDIQCTSPTATIPVNLTHVLHFGLNASIHVSMTCENPNPYSILMRSTAYGSHGTMFVPDLLNFSNPPILAGDVIFKEMDIAAGRKSTADISEAAVLSSDFIRESLTYIVAHNKTFPAYMEMDIKTDAQARFMFIPKLKQDVLPRKYCGYYLGMNAEMTMLSITSPMVCRNSYQEMQTAVATLDSQAGPIGFVDSLAPAQETLDSLENEVQVGSGIVMALGYGLCVVLWVAAAVSARSARSRSKAAKNLSAASIDAGPTHVEPVHVQV